MKSPAQRRLAEKGAWNLQRLVRLVWIVRKLGHREVRFDSRIVSDGIEWRA
jgi:hypothetical protein